MGRVGSTRSVAVSTDLCATATRAILRPMELGRNSLAWMVIALALAPAVARAAEPILDDLERARTLTPPPGSLSGVVAAEPEPPPVEREVATVRVHGRWITMPGPFFELFFDHYQTLSNPSFGASYEWGDINSAMWSVELDWSSLVIDAGNWLESPKPASSATYAEPALHMLSVDAMYRRQFPISDRFRAMIGGGLGLGILLGQIRTSEVLPTCESPLDACPHWPNATRKNADLPTRIVPVVHISLGLELDIAEGFSARLQGGFRNLVYLGLSVGRSL